MHRCLELARLGAGYVAPNPMVGAVLVHENTIIGEGYHQLYGGPHAEVNCLNSVIEENKAKIPSSTLYVSLEPCAHFGKTPPCADLIIQHKIPHVIIGCRDPFDAVNGKGMEKLKDAGIKVETGVLEKECIELNRRFFTFQLKKRPYIILKWAQTANGKIATVNTERLYITNDYSNKLVHRWRSEEAGILKGTKTALQDDPLLTNRHWPGPSPIRLVLDLSLRLPSYLQIFGDHPSIVLTHFKKENTAHTKYYQMQQKGLVAKQVTEALFDLKIQSVLIEGGAQVLQSFINEGLWDEARIITNTQLMIPDGLNAPLLTNARLMEQQSLMSDSIYYYQPNP